MTSKTVASLFEKEPGTWGLRGDPHLWQEMRGHFVQTPIPSTVEELIDLVESAFETLTGHPISDTEHFYIERFSHGGMSSGHIAPEFWQEKVIPLMRERFGEFGK